MGQAVGDDLKFDYTQIAKIDLFALYGVFIIFIVKNYYKIIKIAHELNFRVLLIIK